MHFWCGKTFQNKSSNSLMIHMKLSLVFPADWVLSCWGSCLQCNMWGSSWRSWREYRCCWASCTAGTWSCCGASPGSWSSCVRIQTPGLRSGAGGACSSSSVCSTCKSYKFVRWILLWSFVFKFGQLQRKVIVGTTEHFVYILVCSRKTNVRNINTYYAYSMLFFFHEVQYYLY